jgi:hypothetical protein
MDFGVGLSMGELGKGYLRGQVAGWKEQALRMERELDDARHFGHSQTFKYNGAIELIKEMLEEIQESNPTPVSQSGFLRERLKELALQEALQSGLVLDYENDRVSDKP